MPRIGVFGGSFDPIHNGHLIVISEMIEVLSLDKLVVIPAARSPHKPLGSSLTDSLRLAAVKAALSSFPRVEIDECELNRPPPSYTFDTLTELTDARPDADWYLILGADSLKDFPRWKDADEILRRCTLALAMRPGSIVDRTPIATAFSNAKVIEVPTTPCGISSTLVRARWRAGLTLKGYVPDSVAALLDAAR